MKLSIIVPCYNEVDNVPRLRNELLPVIKDLLVYGQREGAELIDAAEIIFVDDGSRDETFARLKAVFADQHPSAVTTHFLQHEINLGLGAAIRTGFAKANGDVLMTVDSDGTYPFSDIPGLLALLKGEVDIVTASPYHPQGGVMGVPAYRLVLSRGSSFLYRVLVDRHVYTYTCLFRAYRGQVVRSIRFESNDFLAGTELLVKAMLKGYRVAEFPAVLHRRTYGVSKARIVQTIVSHLKFQAAVLLYRMQSTIGLKPRQTL